MSFHVEKSKKVKTRKKNYLMKNRNIIFPTILLALACFGLSPVAQAKQPSEDRGNGNSAAEDVQALNLSTTGSGNTAHGWFSLFSNTSGSYNTADGALALNSNTTGVHNTASGFTALSSNTTGIDNTASGFQALFNNTEGGGNTAIGSDALYINTTGSFNTANGFQALYNNTEGTGNTAIGDSALLYKTTGNRNTAMGEEALLNNTTGSSNTALGASAGSNVTTATNVICIGHPGADVSNSCFIGNIRGVGIVAEPVPVAIDSAGRLGTIPSSERFKKEIKPMDRTSEAVLALRPVTFHYKTDVKGTPCFGLIAEEVAEVNANLVVRDKNGEPYTVRYDAVNVMLLNEFLKEHRMVQQLEANATAQREEIKVLATAVKEQASQIQKLSAHIEVNTPRRNVVLNNPQDGL